MVMRSTTWSGRRNYGLLNGGDDDGCGGCGDGGGGGQRCGRRRARIQTGRGADPPGDSVRRPWATGPQRAGPAPARRPAATAPVGRRGPGVDRPQPMGSQAHVCARHDHAEQRFDARGPSTQNPPVVAGGAVENPKVSVYFLWCMPKDLEHI